LKCLHTPADWFAGRKIKMKTKMICAAILALVASFSAVAQDAAQDLNDPAALCRVTQCSGSGAAK
jgi:hypothetical protein